MKVKARINADSSANANIGGSNLNSYRDAFANSNCR